MYYYLCSCGMICCYVTNERMTTLFSDVSNTLTGNVQDFTKYANNTINVSMYSVCKQLTHLAHNCMAPTAEYGSESKFLFGRKF